MKQKQTNPPFPYGFLYLPVANMASMEIYQIYYDGDEPPICTEKQEQLNKISSWSAASHRTPVNRETLLTYGRQYPEAVKKQQVGTLFGFKYSCRETDGCSAQWMACPHKAERKCHVDPHALVLEYKEGEVVVSHLNVGKALPEGLWLIFQTEQA